MIKFGVDHALLDPAHIIEDSECCLVMPAVIAREGVFHYPEGDALKLANELREATWTADAAWLIAEQHPDTMILMDRGEIIGRPEKPRFVNDAMKANLRFYKSKCNPQFLNDVKTGKKRDVSVGFFYEYDATPGEWKGQHYDFVQRNILLNHVAVGVPKGRCAPPLCGIAVDSALRSAHPSKRRIRIALDPEETEEKIHIPIIAGADQFETCRTTDFDGKLPEGVKAVYCKHKDSDEWVIQKYIFDKPTWTMEKAQAWVKEHKEATDEEGEGFSLEEIKQKIADLAKRRSDIMDILYPRKELPEERKQLLESELAVIDAEISALKDAMAAKMIGDQEEEGELEKKREAAKERCAKCPITFKEGKGHLTKPEEYANVDDDDFADPCNYKYPMVPDDRLMNAWQRLNQDENREEGGYTEEEWSWIKNRVKKRMEAKGHEVQADAELERSKRLLSYFNR